MDVFLFTTTSRPDLGPTNLSKGYWWLLSLGINWPGCEADHSPPSSAEVKNAWSNISKHPPLHMTSWHGT